MNIAISITNHNQNNLVTELINSLKQQTIIPNTIIVESDDTPYITTDPIVICDNHKDKGRCKNRNKAILPFIISCCDALIFIDGDCYVKDKDFIKKYIKHLTKYDLVFGTRKHSDITGLIKPPSDLLTANMDELWNKKELNYKDLRIVSGAVDAWQHTTDFYERLDLMITGMIGWSCNFGITHDALIKHLEFMKKYYGNAILFDDTAFNKGWGYEDVAMGIDALFCGLNIWIDSDIEVIHNSHNRTDGLFDHIKGRHLIMCRMRELEYKLKIKDFKYNWFYKLQKFLGIK